MKYSQNQVVNDLGLEFAPQDGRVAVIEKSVLATTRRVLGSNAHEQLKKHLRVVRQQRLERNSEQNTYKAPILSHDELSYYQSNAEALRQQAIVDSFNALIKHAKKLFSGRGSVAANETSDWPSVEQVRTDIANGARLRAETVAAGFAKIGQTISKLFKPTNTDSNATPLISDSELRRHIEHAQQLRSTLMADAIFTGFRSVATSIAKFTQRVRQWHRQRVTWRELNSLSDYLLHDIGLNRDQLKHLSKDIVSRKGTWIDQVARNLQVTPAPAVANVDEVQTPEHAANDGHRELAA